MPNAFASLGPAHYGPQFTHNVAFLADREDLASGAESWFRAFQSDRLLGSVSALREGAVPASPTCTLRTGVAMSAHMEDLDDLDSGDFDSVVSLVSGELLAPIPRDWLDRESFMEWDLSNMEPEETRDTLKARVLELLARFDDLAMKSACGPGTSC